MGFPIQTLYSYYLNVRRYLRIFRLDDKLCWMKRIPIAAIVSMIQLIYEYVKSDKKKPHHLPLMSSPIKAQSRLHSIHVSPP